MMYMKKKTPAKIYGFDEIEQTYTYNNTIISQKIGKKHKKAKQQLMDSCRILLLSREKTQQRNNNNNMQI